MATKDNHTSSPTKGQPPTKGRYLKRRRPDPKIRVRATCNLISDQSRLIVLKHTPGRVLDFTKRGLLIDFGLSHVSVLPADSPLIENVNGPQKD